MNMIKNYEQCYACHACEASCTSRALKFLEKSDGINYPIIDTKKCKECGKCISKCAEELEHYIPKHYFLFEDKSIDDLINSSSGGAFYRLLEAYYEPDNTVIYGASYDKLLNVIHQSATNLEEAKKFRKSKYVQSDLRGCFCEIKKYLKEGKRVLFSGTPCQVYGLRKFLGCDYKNLLTIDLICTGVMSPCIFQKFLAMYKGEKIKYFDWRYKHPINDMEWNVMDSSITIDNQTRQDEFSTLIKKLYGKRYGYKKACYSCKFASTNRYADITLGDWWGMTSIFGNYPNRGISVILVNSEKGYKLIEKINLCKVNICEGDLNEILYQNPALTRATTEPISNEKFWIDFYNMDIKKLLKKYTKSNWKSTLKMFAAELLPTKVVEFIQKKKQS